MLESAETRVVSFSTYNAFTGSRGSKHTSGIRSLSEDFVGVLDTDIVSERGDYGVT